LGNSVSEPQEQVSQVYKVYSLTNDSTSFAEVFTYYIHVRITTNTYD